MTYGYWAIIALSFSAPLFGLSRIPSREEILEGESGENIFFTFIVKFVALPFLVLYFLILYAYSIDVLVHFQDWPK